MCVHQHKSKRVSGSPSTTASEHEPGMSTGEPHSESEQKLEPRMSEQVRALDGW